MNIGGELEYRPLITLTYTKGIYSDVVDYSYIHYGTIDGYPSVKGGFITSSKDIPTSYVQLISPEISINPDATNNLIGTDSYFDSIFGLASIVKTKAAFGKSDNVSIAAVAGKYLKYDGTYEDTSYSDNNYIGLVVDASSTYTSDMNYNVNKLTVAYSSGG